MFNKLLNQALNIAENLNEMVADMAEKNAPTINQKCPNCGAQISGKTCHKTLTCTYCGSSVKNKHYVVSQIPTQNYNIGSQTESDFIDED